MYDIHVIYVCNCTYMNVETHTKPHHVHTLWMYTELHVHMYININMLPHTRLCTHMHTYTHHICTEYIHIHTHVHKNTCLYTYINTLQTHAHMLGARVYSASNHKEGWWGNHGHRRCKALSWVRVESALPDLVCFILGLVSILTSIYISMWFQKHPDEEDHFET